MIQIQSEEVTVNTIEQRVIETTDRAKPDALRFVMDRDQPFLAVIFCRTKVRASKLYDDLKGEVIIVLNFMVIYLKRNVKEL